MSTTGIIIALLAVVAAADEFDLGLGGGGGGGAVGAKKAESKVKKGEWSSTKSVTVNGVAFKNPTWKRFELKGKKVPTFAVLKDNVQYYVPLVGHYSAMWLTYKDIKNPKTGKVKKNVLVVDQQQFRVWYRKICTIDSFTGAVTCGYCFNIKYLAGILDYGATKGASVGQFKFQMGEYHPQLNLIKDHPDKESKHEVVSTTLTAGGQDYSIFLATSGKFEGNFIIGKKDNVVVITALNAVTVYQRKYCAKGLHGYRCRWCFVLQAKTSKTPFLPGPNIAMTDTLYLNNPNIEHVTIDEIKGYHVRVILSQKGTADMKFYYYILDGKKAGQWRYYNEGQKAWIKPNIPALFFTNTHCTTAGNPKTCTRKVKMYKVSAIPKIASSFTVGQTTMKSPKVAKVKTPGWKIGSVRAAVWQATYKGEGFALNYAMDGKYAGVWFYVNTFSGTIKVFTALAAKSLFHNKRCKENFSGDTVCTWCFMMVDVIEKATALPKGKVVTVDGAIFHSPSDMKHDSHHYTQFSYAKAKINKILLLKRTGKDASSGRWFEYNEKGRLVPYDVSYDVYFSKSCHNFDKKKACRNCYIVQARPNLAIKPIQPSKEITINGIVLSSGKQRLYTIHEGRKKGKAYMFKACKGTTCTSFYYMISGPHSGSWFTGVAKKNMYFKTSLITKTLWRHHECQDGLSGTTCRECFEFL